MKILDVLSLDISPKKLLSRTIRSNASQGRVGLNMLTGAGSGGAKGGIIRTIGSLTKLAKKPDKKSGLLGFLWDKGSSFLGFLGKKAWQFVSFSWTSVMGWIVTQAQRLKAFNWNASDADLKRMIDGANNALGARWGSVAGQTIGWTAGIAVGYGVSYLVPVIGGAALARAIATKVGTEALEEITSGLFGAVAGTATTLMNNALISGYMTLRRNIKSWSPAQLERHFGKDGAEFAKNQWGKEGGLDYSFNASMDRWVESIKNPFVRGFVEALLEEAEDSFIEAGFIIAAELDGAYSQAKQASVKALGSTRTVEITLDKDVTPSSEKENLRIYQMPQKLMQQEIQRTVNTFRMIHNRDVGMVMGMPVEEYTKAKPQSLRIVIDLFSLKRPPYFRRTDKLQHATITIPDARRGALDWNMIKQAVGGANGYQWGRFRAVASLSTGRRLVVHAGSEQAAENLVNSLLLLSDAKLLTLNITEEKKLGERLMKPKLQKESTRVYPAYFTIINREEFLDPTQGSPSARQKNYRDNRGRVPLYFDTEPPGTKDLIRQIMTKGL